MEQAFRHINNFVYLFPLFMSFVWMVGALIFFYRHEKNNTQPQELAVYPFFFRPDSLSQ